MSRQGVGQQGPSVSRQARVTEELCRDRLYNVICCDRGISIVTNFSRTLVATEFSLSRQGVGLDGLGARDSPMCARDSERYARDKPVTVHCVVHCLDHCSWTLYMGTVKEKKKYKNDHWELGRHIYIYIYIYIYIIFNHLTTQIVQITCHVGSD